VDLIHIREPGLDDRTLVEVVRAAVAATARTGASIVVNDRLDVALAAGAAGVHLRASAFPASRVRKLAPPGILVGRSVHSVEEARSAERDGACDYLVFGTVFASNSKPTGHPVAGVDALRAVCASVRLPVLGIGGITPALTPAIAAAGAAGLAAIGVFSEAPDLPALVRSLRQSFDT
jgi:thiamine-phosphate diphosphorylase